MGNCMANQNNRINKMITAEEAEDILAQRLAEIFVEQILLAERNENEKKVSEIENTDDIKAL